MKDISDTRVQLHSRLSAELDTERQIELQLDAEVNLSSPAS